MINHLLVFQSHKHNHKFKIVFLLSTKQISSTEQFICYFFTYVAADGKSTDTSLYDNAQPSNYGLFPPQFCPFVEHVKGILFQIKNLCFYCSLIKAKIIQKSTKWATIPNIVIILLINLFAQ